MPKVHLLSLPHDEVIPAALLLGQIRNVMHPDLRFAEGVQCVIKECRADIQDEWRSSKPLTDTTRKALLSMSNDLPDVCVLSSDEVKQRFVDLCMAHPNFPANTRPILATVSDMAQNARDRERVTLEYERVLSEAVQRGELKAFKPEEGNPFHPAGKMDKIDLITYLYRHEVVGYLPSIGFSAQPYQSGNQESGGDVQEGTANSMQLRWAESELLQVPTAKRRVLFKELLKVLPTCRNQRDSEEVKRQLFHYVEGGHSSRRMYIDGGDIRAYLNEHSKKAYIIKIKNIDAILDEIGEIVDDLRSVNRGA